MLVLGALHPGCADILVSHYGCFCCMQFSIEDPSLHHATCIRSWSSPCSGCMRVSASLERARQLAYRLGRLDRQPALADPWRLWGPNHEGVQARWLLDSDLSLWWLHAGVQRV